MTVFIEISGRTVSGETVSSGTNLDIGSGGVAIDTVVQYGGSEVLSSGGMTIDTGVYDGGYEVVAASGFAQGTTITFGGYLLIASAGSALGASVSAGGFLINAGTATETSSASGASVSTYLTVSSGQISSGLVIGATTRLAVQAGGVALSTTVTSGGEEIVGSGGLASATIIGSGAFFEVDGGGTAFDTMSQAGGVESVIILVASGAVSSGLLVDSVTSLHVASGGTTSATTVTRGGIEVVSGGGTDLGTTLSAGGYEVVSSGVAFDTQDGGVLDVGAADGVDGFGAGTAIGVVITGGGVESVSLGAITSDTTIAGSGTLDLYGGDSATGSILFGGSAVLDILDDQMPLATISGFGASDAMLLSGLSFGSGGSAGFADGVLTLSGYNSGDPETHVYSLSLAGNYSGATFVLSDLTLGDGRGEGTEVTVSGVPCFAAGTLIATARGMVAVEHLAPGDDLLTVDGTAEPIIWIGSRAVDCRRHPVPAKIWPVRIAAHAFGPGRPARDLFLSPDHAVFAEGVLIPVKHLINGTSIAQMAVRGVSYHHVELPRHAVIMAESLPVESYLDTGDRTAFARPDGPSMLHAAFGGERADVSLVAEALGYAPLRVTGPQVARVRAALAVRAGSESVLPLLPMVVRRPR